MLEEVADILQDARQLVAAGTVLVGLIHCFFGYRVFKLMIALWGFAVGAVFGGALGFLVSGTAGAALGAVLGGLLCALLAYVLYLVGVFVLGALAGALLSGLLMTLAGAEPYPPVAIAAAVLGGIAAVCVQKLVIILGTAFTGAWSAVTGIAVLVGRAPAPSDAIRDPDVVLEFVASHQVLLIAWVALAVVGVVLQYGLTCKDDQQETGRVEASAGAKPARTRTSRPSGRSTDRKVARR